MHVTRQFLVIAALGLSVLLGGCATKKKKKAPEKSKYEQTIADARESKGLLSVYHNKKNKLYFGIPDSLMGRDLYFINLPFPLYQRRQQCVSRMPQRV